MARFEIYCPCKVKDIGVGIVDGNKSYLFIPMIQDENNPRGLCKFCGNRIKIVGNNPTLDKLYRKHFYTKQPTP